MATIRKFKTGYRAEVCVKGVRKSKLLPTASEAKLWAAQTEIELSENPKTIANKLTVSNLLDRWADRYLESRTLVQWETNKIKQFKTMRIASVRLADLDPVEVSKWRDERLRTVSSGTVNREWNLFSGIFTAAVEEMGLIEQNPFRKTKRPEKPEARTRIPTDKELEALEQCLPTRIWLIVQFAVETGMRAGEIVRSRWENVHEKYIHLPKDITKTRTRRDVPLSAKARQILAELPKGDTLFCVKSSSLDTQWRKGVKQAMIEDLHFHDLRALAATRWSKVLTPLELAKMLGHKNLSMLQVYYRESVEDIADKLG